MYDISGLKLHPVYLVHTCPYSGWFFRTITPEPGLGSAIRLLEGTVIMGEMAQSNNCNAIIG
ncbi:hypothetical protein J6590_074441 [Homalodisca vitripennis]|nr:hypothetical protein J6590_074441 [Homalodisca vitripennis]